MRSTPLAVTLLWMLSCHGYRILLVPLPMRSHVFNFHVLGKELERQGHEVHMTLERTYKIPDTFAENTSTVFHRFAGNEKLDFETINSEFVKELLTGDLGMQYQMERAQFFSKLIAEDVLLNSEQLLSQLESIKFDAAIVDSLFFMKFNVLIPHRLKCPMIIYTDSPSPWIIRTPWLPSIFNPMLDSTGPKTSFFVRLQSLVAHAMWDMLPMVRDPDEGLLEKYRRYGHFDDLNELTRKAMLFLIPSDPVLDAVLPVTANVVLVGGLTTDFTTIASSSSSLPEDYRAFIETSNSNGTIIVSFGTMVTTYPRKVAQLFITAFARLPEYKFVWRFHNDLALDIPPNVMITDWMPQKELLSHPSVKLFITHSGNNGQYEAIYHGVPMLAIPLLGDQYRNADRIVEKGFGERTGLHSTTVESLVGHVKKIVSDPRYKERTAKASKMFRNRREKPAERAAFWVKHVIEFGADHLRPAGNDLHFWQYLCLDVLLFVQLCLVAVMTIIFLVLRKCLRLLNFTGKTKKQKQV